MFAGNFIQSVMCFTTQFLAVFHKQGWRKISFYFNLSFEIKDKSIEFDDNRNVVRAEFVARAHMQ